jgi:hypothetical protein
VTSADYPPGGPPAPGHRTLNVILRDAIRAAQPAGDAARLPGLREECTAAAGALFDMLAPPPSEPGPVADYDPAARVAAWARAGVPAAAPRDASCYNSPSHASERATRSHVGGKYHAVADGEMAACAPVLLVLESARPAADLDPALLCRRRPCRAAFAAGVPG